MIEIRNSESLNFAMSKKFGKYWYLQESFKRTYGENQLIEKIIIPKILSDFKNLCREIHYRHSKKALLGLLGELVVKYFVGGELSDDKFDSEKDIVLENGCIIEVKVVSYYHKENAFLLKDNKTKTTINKLVNVDYVYVIERKKNTIVLYRNTKKDNYVRHDIDSWNSILAPSDDFEEVAVMTDQTVHALFLKLSHERFDKSYMRN